MTMRRYWGPLCLLILAGCSGGGGVPVKGLVTLDGAPLASADVSFHPASATTEGIGGSGRTGEDGKFTIKSGRGGEGLPPGDYKVVISYRTEPDGKPADPNVPPVESNAREQLPKTYSELSSTTLRATVAADRPSHDFPLLVKKKK